MSPVTTRMEVKVTWLVAESLNVRNDSNIHYTVFRSKMIILEYLTTISRFLDHYAFNFYQS